MKHKSIKLFDFPWSWSFSEEYFLRISDTITCPFPPLPFHGLNIWIWWGRKHFLPLTFPILQSNRYTCFMFVNKVDMTLISTVWTHNELWNFNDFLNEILLKLLIKTTLGVTKKYEGHRCFSFIVLIDLRSIKGCESIQRLTIMMAHGSD